MTDAINRKALKENYKAQEKIGGVIAYKNKRENKRYLDIAQDLAGSQNRFSFAKSTGLGLPRAVEKVWQAEDFEFEVLEELKKTDLQTDKAFKEDLEMLKAIWLEKFSAEELY